MSRCATVAAFFPIAIPSNQSFLKQWYNWTHAKVQRHFKRDKDRVFDTAQNVRLRLLSKDFIGRWFYKHLTDELVDRKQAEKILGGVPITFVGHILPVDVLNASCQNKACTKRRAQGHGCARSCSDSLWKVADLLAFAKFDYERYYYSMQGHTIDSAKVLRLLGYRPTEYNVLKALYIQGKLKPSELTDHECVERIIPGKRRGGQCGVKDCDRRHYSLGYCSTHYHLSRVRNCPECDHGRELLRARGISVAHNWADPEVANVVSKLRWNDKQLKPFLREWKRHNMVSASPDYIMRRDPKQGIDAGLLKYAEMVIDHEVVNDFKRISRSDDLSNMVLNNGMSPEHGDTETVFFESNGKEEGDGNPSERIICDLGAREDFSRAEHWHDIRRLVSSADLTEEETEIVIAVDLGDISISEYADQSGLTVQRIHRVRAGAHKKLSRGEASDVMPRMLAVTIANRHNCSVEDIAGTTTFGSCVLARTELFSSLFDVGMTVSRIATCFGIAEDRVVAAINRSCIRESRNEASAD